MADWINITAKIQVPYRLHDYPYKLMWLQMTRPPFSGYRSGGIVLEVRCRASESHDSFSGFRHLQYHVLITRHLSFTDSCRAACAKSGGAGFRLLWTGTWPVYSCIWMCIGRVSRPRWLMVLAVISVTRHVFEVAWSVDTKLMKMKQFLLLKNSKKNIKIEFYHSQH